MNSTEKSLTEHGDKISQEEKEAIEKALEEAKTALEGDDIEDNKAKTEALSTVAMKLGEAMYKEAQEQAGNPDAAAGDEPKTEDADIVDAEYSNVSEDTKKSS